MFAVWKLTSITLENCLECGDFMLEENLLLAGCNLTIAKGGFIAITCLLVLCGISVWSLLLLTQPTYLGLGVLLVNLLLGT